MSTEKNKDLIRRYLDAISGKEKPPAVVDQYVADSDQKLKQHIAFSEGAFPRYELIAEDMIAEGDLVTVRATVRGTHQGDLMGIPPTGKQVEMPLIIIYRVADGKIVEHWMVADQLGMMQQLGVIPAPAPA
jgi:predicted ester cyclase